MTHLEGKAMAEALVQLMVAFVVLGIRSFVHLVPLSAYFDWGLSEVGVRVPLLMLGSIIYQVIVQGGGWLVKQGAL